MASTYLTSVAGSMGSQTHVPTGGNMLNYTPLAGTYGGDNYGPVSNGTVSGGARGRRRGRPATRRRGRPAKSTRRRGRPATRRRGRPAKSTRRRRRGRRGGCGCSSNSLIGGSGIGFQGNFTMTPTP